MTHFKTSLRSILSIITLMIIILTSALTAEAAVPVKPSGKIPNGLSQKLMVGFFENTNDSWMKESNIPWDVRYIYITKGWENNWGWGSRDGWFAKNFMTSCADIGAVPAIQYYCMNGTSAGGEWEFYSKVKNPSAMKEYFSDVKLMMQCIKEFKKPVILMIEADGYGFLQQQTDNNPNAYAAISATGIPELKGLPDTVAGWGLAFLKLKKEMGVDNVILGMHVSGWAGGKDLMYYSVQDALQPEVDKVYAFLSPLGLAANMTGATYDILVSDPLDRDPDFYRITKKEDRWLDPSDKATVASKSFNRYAEWLRLWNIKSGKRILLWQIPLGNSNHLNVENNGGPRQGYKGNFPEYFFGTNGKAHREKMASSGVIGLLFGAGAGGQSSYQNDIYTDGKPFMKTYAGKFMLEGGASLP